MPATYIEINGLLNDGPLSDRVGVAVTKTAYNVSNEAADTANHAGRLAWAKAALADVPGTKTKILKFVVAGYVVAHAADDLAAVTAGLTDAVIQSYVDASLAVFAA